MRLRHSITLLMLLLLNRVSCVDLLVLRRVDLPYVADAVGNTLPLPEKLPAKVGSPSNLLTPEKYEFYTFDESGELVKKFMTLEEIQEIVAAGDGNEGHLVTLTEEYEPVIAFNFSEASNKNVHNVVTSVQNVLKSQLEAHKKQPLVPPSTFDTPDVSDSWSLILPSVFGNTGVDIIPDKLTNSFVTPETETIEVAKPEIFVNNEKDTPPSVKEAVQVQELASSVTTGLKNKETSTKKTPQSNLNPSTKNNIFETKRTTKKPHSTLLTRQPTTAMTKVSSVSTNLPPKVSSVFTIPKISTSSSPQVTVASSSKIAVTSNFKGTVPAATNEPVFSAPSRPISSTKNPFTTLEPSKSSVHTTKHTKNPVNMTPSTTTNLSTMKTTHQTQTSFSPGTVINYLTSKLPSTEPTKLEQFTLLKLTQTSQSVPILAQTTTHSIVSHKTSTFTDSIKMVSTTPIPRTQPATFPQKPTHLPTIIPKNASEEIPANSNSMQYGSPAFDMSQSMSQIVSDLGNLVSFEKIQKNATILPTSKPKNPTTESTNSIIYKSTPSSTTTTKKSTSSSTTVKAKPVNFMSTTKKDKIFIISADNLIKSTTPSAVTVGSTLKQIRSTTPKEPQPPLIDLNVILDLSGSMSDLLSQVVDDRPSGLILNTSDITTVETILERNEDMDIMIIPSPTVKLSNKTTSTIESLPNKEAQTVKFSSKQGQVENKNSSATIPEKSLLLNSTSKPQMLGDIKNTINIPSERFTVKTTSDAVTKISSIGSLNKEVTKASQNTDFVKNQISTKYPFTKNHEIPTLQTKSEVTSSKMPTNSSLYTSTQKYSTTFNTANKTPGVLQKTVLSTTVVKIASTTKKPVTKTTSVKSNSTTLPTTKPIPAKKQDLKNQIAEQSKKTYSVQVNKSESNTTSEKTSVKLPQSSTYKSPNKTTTYESDGTSPLPYHQSDKRIPSYTDSKINEASNATLPNKFVLQQYKINDTKRKIQKVNIDVKEQLENLNVSWKLVSTVSPPRPLTLQNETNTTGDKTNELYSDPGKVINLDSSKENQGLEATTKYLSKDLHLFSELCNELGFKYWHSIVEDVDKKRSFVLSPYAITSMLAMLFMGARGATSGEMNDILKLDEMITFNPHFVLKNISDSIDNAPSSGVYASAFVRELFSDRNSGKILSFYKERAHQFYGGHVEEVNFRLISDIIRRRTNLLVKRHSWGRISEYIKNNNIFVNPPLAAFSVNVFQTDCSGTVTDGRDGEMYFVVSPSVRHRRLVPVPAVVYKTNFLAGYDPVLDATAVSIGDGSAIVSIVFVMPGQQGNAVHSDDLDELEKRLLGSNPTTPSWNRLLRTLLPRMGLELQIPRFSHTSMLNITTVLQRLGINDIFDKKKADLGGISGPSNLLYVSDLIQSNSFATCGEEAIGEQQQSEIYPGDPLRRRKTFKLNEGFGEPRDYQRAFHDPNDLGHAALLPLHLRPRQARVPASSSPSSVARLKFDRPFLYFVRHNPTGMILFLGRYNPRLLP